MKNILILFLIGFYISSISCSGSLQKNMKKRHLHSIYTYYPPLKKIKLEKNENYMLKKIFSDYKKIKKEKFHIIEKLLVEGYIKKINIYVPHNLIDIILKYECDCKYFDVILLSTLTSNHIFDIYYKIQFLFEHGKVNKIDFFVERMISTGDECDGNYIDPDKEFKVFSCSPIYILKKNSNNFYIDFKGKKDCKVRICDKSLYLSKFLKLKYICLYNKIIDEVSKLDIRKLTNKLEYFTILKFFSALNLIHISYKSRYSNTEKKVKNMELYSDSDDSLRFAFKTNSIDTIFITNEFLDDIVEVKIEKKYCIS